MLGISGDGFAVVVWVWLRMLAELIDVDREGQPGVGPDATSAKLEVTAAYGMLHHCRFGVSLIGSKTTEVLRIAGRLSSLLGGT